LFSVIVLKLSVNITQGTGSTRIESACPIRSISIACQMKILLRIPNGTTRIEDSFKLLLKMGI